MNRTIPLLFRFVRKSRGMNQAQFAIALNVNQSTISRVESMQREAGYLLLRKLYKFTGMNIEQLVSEMRKHPQRTGGLV